MINVTEGNWFAAKGDVLNPDRTWGIVYYLSEEAHREIDGEDAVYPSRTEVIAEVCPGPTDEADAHLLAAAKDMRDALKMYLALDNRRHAGIPPTSADWARCWHAASAALGKAHAL